MLNRTYRPIFSRKNAIRQRLGGATHSSWELGNNYYSVIAHGVGRVDGALGFEAGFAGSMLN